MVENLAQVGQKFELDQVQANLIQLQPTQAKWVAKRHTQLHPRGWPNVIPNSIQVGGQTSYPTPAKWVAKRHTQLQPSGWPNDTQLQPSGWPNVIPNSSHVENLAGVGLSWECYCIWPVASYIIITNNNYIQKLLKYCILFS